MSHRKRPLPSGKYTGTITNAEIKDNLLEITWTIDTGEYAWRNLKERFPIDDWGIDKLKGELEQLGYIMYTNFNKPLFIKQFFVNRFRSELTVERELKDGFIRNVIIEHAIAKKVADYDVKKDRDDSFYFKDQDDDRDLPINI